jgi:predicted secreted protein with PEFG-CTERM motif
LHHNIYVIEKLVKVMFHGKIREIFLTVMLFSFSAIILSSYYNFDLNQKSSAFAQTPDPLTDPGSGPIPEDNTSNIANGPIPEDNSTSFVPPDITSTDNQTDTFLPSDINSTAENNATSQVVSNPPAVPEFGSLAWMIITISIIGVLVISRGYRFQF